MTKFRPTCALVLVACLMLATPLHARARAFAAPVATSFSTTVSTVGATAIQLQGSDADGTALTFAIGAAPAHGTISNLNPATGALVFTPTAGYVGTDSCTFMVTSGGDTSAAATVSLTVTNAKTRIIDTLINPDGSPRVGKVTFILTQATTSPGGLISPTSSVSAVLNSSGQFDVSLYPSSSLSPQSFYQVYFEPSSGAGRQLLGLYSIPASAVTVTLAPYRVTDTNLTARYVFSSETVVQSLAQNAGVAAAAAATAALGINALGTNTLPKANGAGGLVNSRVGDTGTTITLGGNTSVSGALTASGTISATSFSGNGAALTGIPGATGNVSNTGSTTIGADTDVNLVGKISLQTGGVERLGIEADGTIVAPGGISAPDRGAQVVNIKAYGATCDGVTDDTAAITAALAYALTNRKPLYIPSAPVGCLITAASGQIFLLNKMSIEIFGDGNTASRLIVKTTTPNTVDVFHFSPPATGGQPTGAWAHQENGRDNRGLNLHDFAILAQSEPSMYTQPYPSQPARHALYFDTRTPGQFIEGVTIERCWFGSLSGHAMVFDNSNGGTWANLDGQYQMVISNNVIRNGIVGDWWGDSLRIVNNRFLGENAAVDSKQVTGATTLNFMDNNCTSRGGCGTFHNGYTINYLRNIVELGFAGSVGVNGALVDFRGDLDEIKGLTVEGNIFNSIGAGDTLDGIRLNNTFAARIGKNDYNSATSGTHYRIVTTTSSIYTHFGALNLNMTGTAALTNTTGGDPFPLYETATINAEPDVSTPLTFIPGFFGVDHVYAKQSFVTGGTTPLAAATGAGLDTFFDSDAQVAGGAYSASGGAGAATLFSVNRTTGTRLDMQLVGRIGLFDFPDGVRLPERGFATLPSGAANGIFIYCADCTKATPCSSGGTGALAKRLNGAWDCN